MVRLIEGRNPVYEALRAGTEIHELLIREGTHKGKIDALLHTAENRGIHPSEVSSSRLEKLSVTRNHQGVIARAADYRFRTLDEVLSTANEGEDPLLLVLDRIQDPHNLGSILRSAEGAGVDGVIIPERRAAQPSPVVNRVSAGAMEHLSLIRVKNTARTIERLKKEWIWVCGTKSEGAEVCFEAELDRPLALVIGNEGYGISRLVDERCDFHVRLPMFGKIGALNAGVAAAILLYEAVRQRRF